MTERVRERDPLLPQRGSTRESHDTDTDSRFVNYSSSHPSFSSDPSVALSLVESDVKLGPTRFEKMLLLLGALGSIGLGAAPLAFYYFFGDLLSQVNDMVIGEYMLDGTSIGMAEVNEAISEEVVKTSYKFFIIAAAAGLSAALQFTPLIYCGERISSRLRLSLFRSILIQDIGWFDQTDSGVLISNLSEDCVKVKDAYGEKLGQSIQALTQCFGGLGFALYKSWSMSLIMLGMTPVIAIPIVFQATQIRQITTDMSTASADAMTSATENISGIRTVRAFSMEPTSLHRFSLSLTKLCEIAKKKAFVQGISVGFIQAAIWSACAVAFLFGGYLIRQNNGFNIGDLITVFGMMLFACIGLSQALAILPEFAKASASYQIIYAIISRTPQIPPFGGNQYPELQQAGTVQFKNVTFSYPSRPDVTVMSEVTFEAKPGSVVAFVGESGSGKTTVFNLLERFYDPSGGCVMVNGEDIRTYDPTSLRKMLAIVSQEPVLFAATIRENILFGDPSADDEAVYAAAKVANAHKFIVDLPNGYDTWVGERGVQLSGGQKQRVAIARAVIRNPRILLLDEATSALDTESERLVQEALENIMIGRTSLVIAHRLATVIRSDQIFVFQKGHLVGQGTHEELLKSSDVYQQLALRQLSMGPGSEGESEKIKEME